MLLLVVGLAAVMLGGAALARARVSERGEVSGLILVCGGAPPGRCVARDGSVLALGAGGRAAARARTRHARFVLSLPPGGYTLVARADGTRGRRAIRVEARRVLRADVSISGIS